MTFFVVTCAAARTVFQLASDGPRGASPWAFGWVAIASLLTVALAAGTVWLARATSQDVRARQRPMLWSDGPVLLRVYPPGSGPAIVETVDVEFSLKNIGGGPAVRISVNTHIVFPEGGGAIPPPYVGAVRPGDAESFSIRLPASAEKLLNVAKIQTGIMVMATYRDTRGGEFVSELSYCDVNWPPIFFDELPTEPVVFRLGVADGQFRELRFMARWRLQIKRWKGRKHFFIPPHRPESGKNYWSN